MVNMTDMPSRFLCSWFARRQRRCAFSASICMALLALSLASCKETRVAETAPKARRTSQYLFGANDKPPTRIVSLSPVVTEAVFALGYGQFLVGVTRFCDRPAEASALPKVGGFLDLNIEALLALKPDLVIAMPSQGQKQELEVLKAHGVPVFAGFGDTLDEIFDLIDGIGRVIGREAAAGEAVQNIQSVLQDLKRSSARQSEPLRTLIAVGIHPLVVAGQNVFATDILRRVGGKNAVESIAPWPSLTLESVGALRPQLIVAAGGPDAAKSLREMLKPLGAEAPTVSSAPHAILMRPGIHLADDAQSLQKLLVDARRNQ